MTKARDIADLGDSIINDANNNVALGDGALDDASLSGSNNVAIGEDALAANTTSSDNTAVGYQAGYSNTTGTQNTTLGHTAGNSNTTGEKQTFIGQSAGLNTTGSSNTFVGQSSGTYVTTGANNTILGRFNGNEAGIDMRTWTNTVVLSDGDGNVPFIIVDAGGSPRARLGENTQTTYNNAPLKVERNLTTHGTCIHTYTPTTDSRFAISFGNPNNVSGVGSINTSGSSTSYNTSSDYRLKENVVELTGATDRLKQLNPSRFNFIADADTTVDGFLAHEVQSVVPEAITGTKDAVDADGNPVYQGIDQSKLVPLLVATIKELEARITALEAN